MNTLELILMFLVADKQLKGLIWKIAVAAFDCTNLLPRVQHSWMKICIGKR
jgi:hypothetical protein